MQVEQTKLANGLTVITHSSPYLESAALGAFVNAGSRQETQNNNGIAHFLEHMMFKGTSSRTAHDITTQIEILGSDINAYTSVDMTAYHTTGLASNVDQSIDIIGDVLTDSLFDAADIAMESSVIVQEINRAADNPNSVMYQALQDVSYPDQPFGRPILGSSDFVTNATGDDLHAFVDQYYTADNIVVAAAGGITHDAFVRKVEIAFSGLMPTIVRDPMVKADYVGGTAVDRDKDFKQVQVGISFPSVSVLDDDLYRYLLLADAFGGGMSSPLFLEVREKRGLVYSTGCFATSGIDNGNIIITGGMAPVHVEEFITLAGNEFRKMVGHVTDNDLLRAKNNFLVSTAMLREKPFSTARYMARSYFQYGYVRSMEELYDQISKVTINDLKQAAEQVLAGVASIAVVGPAPELDYQDLLRKAIT